VGAPRRRIEVFQAHYELSGEVVGPETQRSPVLGQLCDTWPRWSRRPAGDGLAEADDKRALSNGLRAFMISAARHLNRAAGRRGAAFPTRYHATQLRTPRQVRNALCYVLNNWRHHAEDTRGPAQRRASLDPYATGLLFDGWLDAPRFTSPGDYEPLPVAGARSWLLTAGWRLHHPLIGLREIPG
jgi:hypothetical protein